MSARIVVLGGGFAGLGTVQRLERRLRADEATITLVSRDNFTLFTPMLPEVPSGGIEQRHIVTPVRAELRRTIFVLGEVTQIDLDAKTVQVAHTITGRTQSLAYDHLVIALGSVTSTFGIPGVAERALPLKTLEDAETLRNRVIANLELADATPDSGARTRLLTLVAVGGGYTGCEAVGELLDFFRSICRFYPTIAPGDVRFVLVEAGGKLLPDLPPAMGAYTTKNLAGRGVEIVFGDGVASIDDGGVTLASGRRFETSTVLWSAGVRPAPLLKSLPLRHARNGGIIVNRDMSVPERPGVWALGDCAWVPMKQPDQWYPATAQHAIREGPRLADNIVATLRGAPTRPFDFTALGTMASLGSRRGVCAFPNGAVLTGFAAWFLWRTYYLARLPGLDRKVRVALDWTLGLLFPRDIAEMRLYTERIASSAAHDAGMVLHDRT
ncbi:MAG: NAD(P)/FAD-dependent oxidoreductase [Candidatus Velthaea sp.]|jgi:NADH dehydrogenase